MAGWADGKFTLDGQTALYFPPPHDRHIENTITIAAAPGAPPAVFKLRSTAADSFWAQPKNGFLAPGSALRLKVVLLSGATVDFSASTFFVEIASLAPADALAFTAAHAPGGRGGLALPPVSEAWDRAVAALRASHPDARKPPTKKLAIKCHPVEPPAGVALRFPSTVPRSATARVAGGATAAPTPAPPTGPGGAGAAFGLAARTAAANEQLSAARVGGAAVEAARSQLVEAPPGAAESFVEALDRRRAGSVRLSVAVFGMLACYAAGIAVGRSSLPAPVEVEAM